ncbi:MAG: hypothetical protein A2Z14_08685 [Chloroflexi bacterium RBG_16_48_8]|nr:MAG: hypothetical protein A2Z14_08685 [Chloroflexi bacterium RBG_16_48_8]
MRPPIPDLMTIKPPKLQGFIIGGLLFILLSGGIIFGILQLASGELTQLLGVWVSLVVIGSPLLLMVGYRLYGLITARYILERDGFFLQWGFSFEQIPISSIENLIKGEELQIRLRPPFGFYWPGCVIGKKKVEKFGLVEFFATKVGRGQVILPLKGRSLVISPPDVETFHQSFLDIVRLGALEEIPVKSIRPDFFSARLWADRLARFLILSGLVLILCLLGYLAFRTPGLPGSVPFGFGITGLPDTFVPPSRLLLLPLVGGFYWLVDLVIGVWLYRLKEDRRIAYVVWFTGAFLGVLLWGAILHLLRAI